ncbi:MAG: hypothetical protein KKG59_03990 [Nanoarchaeota archaeon]|nr:hypothetical protein [Nanoarchaeota archaeon]
MKKAIVLVLTLILMSTSVLATGGLMAVEINDLLKEDTQSLNNGLNNNMRQSTCLVSCPEDCTYVISHNMDSLNMIEEHEMLQVQVIYTEVGEGCGSPSHCSFSSGCYLGIEYNITEYLFDWLMNAPSTMPINCYAGTCRYDMSSLSTSQASIPFYIIGTSNEGPTTLRAKGANKVTKLAYWLNEG